MNALSAESVTVHKKGHLREVSLYVLVGRMQVGRVGTSPVNALSAECVAVRKKGHLREVSLYVLFGRMQVVRVGTSPMNAWYCRNVLQYAKKDTCVKCPYMFYSAVFLAVSLAVRSMQVIRVGTSPISIMPTQRELSVMASRLTAAVTGIFITLSIAVWQMAAGKTDFVFSVIYVSR